MKQTWIRIIAAALFILGQVSSGAAPSLSRGEAVGVAVCQLACCSGPLCMCDMAPRNAPIQPAPAAPVRAPVKDLRSIPVVVQVLETALVPVSSIGPGPAKALGLRLPHSPPALVLHCALLI